MGSEEDITTEMGNILAEAKPVIYGIKCYKKKAKQRKRIKKGSIIKALRQYLMCIKLKLINK